MSLLGGGPRAGPESIWFVYGFFIQKLFGSAANGFWLVLACFGLQGFGLHLAHSPWMERFLDLSDQKIRLRPSLCDSQKVNDQVLTRPRCVPLMGFNWESTLAKPLTLPRISP